MRLPVLDRTIALGALGRAWLVATAPITLILIAQAFTPTEQGFYFTFSSLIALQSFLELGFAIVILNTASHEWAFLSKTPHGEPAGDPIAMARLGGLLAFAVRWYVLAAVIFVIAVGVIGEWLLSQRAAGEVHWREPWWFLVLLTGGLLCFLPISTVLEGCGELPSLARFRLVQVVIGTLALWVAIASGAGLWAAPVWSAVALSRDVAISTRHGRFLRSLLRARQPAAIDWRTEIWPMQWRLAVSGTSNYLAFSLFTPMTFYQHGAAEAGRIGMTLAAITGIQSVAIAWLQARAPMFGRLIARRQYPELNKLFRVTTASILGVAVLGSIALLAIVVGLDAFAHPLGSRLLPPGTTAVFLLGSALVLVSASESTYLRAHKTEPVMVMSVVASVAIAVLIWILGGAMGSFGSALAYAGVFAAVVIWETRMLGAYRRRWHVDGPAR